MVHSKYEELILVRIGGAESILPETEHRRSMTANLTNLNLVQLTMILAGTRTQIFGGREI